MSREADSSDRFGAILDRQYATEREGESQRQCKHERNGYGKKRKRMSVRDRSQRRMSRGY